MLVLGIDPGSRILGYGLVEWGAAPRFVMAGTIEAKKSLPPHARLIEIGSELEVLLREIGAVERVGIEAGFMGGRSAKSDLMLANARGTAYYLAAKVFALMPRLIAPATAKKASTGNGRAEKDQVVAGVARMLRMRTPPSPDAADALAVAIAAAGAA